MDDIERTVKLCFIVGIGVAGICYAFVLWLRLRRCRAWPHTDGTIIRSDMTIHQHNFQKVEKVTIRYSYFVGRRYESERVKVGGFMHMRKRDEMALLLRYPLDKTVQVYYDPYNPKVACLERRGMDSILIIGGFGVFALTIGILLHLFA